MNGERRCAPCAMGFTAPTQDWANAMYAEHVRDCHPEVANVDRLIERIDRLIALWEEHYELPESTA